MGLARWREWTTPHQRQIEVVGMHFVYGDRVSMAYGVQAILLPASRCQSDSLSCLSGWNMEYSYTTQNIAKKIVDLLIDWYLKKVYASPWLFLVLMSLIPTKGNCAEFNYFKLTDIEGSLRLGYSLSDTDVEQVDGSKTYERRPSTKQELTLNTKSYFFHPNLLEMELGCGVRFEQEKLENDYGSNESRGTYYDFNGQFSFLKNKPYPLRLYFVDSNPSQAIGIAGNMTLEEKIYGFDFALLHPLVDTPINLHMEHRNTSGEGFEVLVDDSVDTLSVRVSGSFSDYGYGQLGFSNVTERSGSGSMNLPIQESRSDTREFEWDGRFTFGPEQNLKLTNTLVISANEQSNFSDRDTTRFALNMTWDHTDKMRSFYNYNYTENQYDVDRSSNQQISIGAFTEVTESLVLNGSLRASRDVNTGFERKSKGINGSVEYNSEISERWAMSSSYSAIFDVNDQTSDTAYVPVIGENHIMSGLLTVTLSNEYVVPASIVVSNETRTQIYVENIDYVLTQIGTEIRIERLSSGNILDGQTVLIDYNYETGGTFDYNEMIQSLSLRYSLDKRYNYSILYTTDRQIIQSGIPTKSLNSIERYRFETDAQLPINKSMDYGWRLEFERRIDKLNPFIRSAIDLNFNTRLPFVAGVANLSTGYEDIDNELSIYDIRETYYSALISARPGWGSTANMELTHRRDTGGETPKISNYFTLSYAWTRGRLSFLVRGKHSTEKQDGSSRSHSILEASLIREFR